MKGIISTFLTALALLVFCGCDRVATKGAGGSRDSRGDGAPGLDVEAEMHRRVEAEVAKLTPARPAAAPTPRSAGTGILTPENATQEAPFVNTLGLKFVPVAGTKVLFSVWDTRVQDYAEYARAHGITPENPSFPQGPTHPVVKVSWEDAQAFCSWLSKKEGRTYRLPTDAEWSAAAGLGVEEGSTPQEKDFKGPANVYPWGTQWPPPKGAGNYADQTGEKAKSGVGNSDGDDGWYAHTSPVGSFAANQNGLYDMGGNVWQWCEDWYDEKKLRRVRRGASRYTFGVIYLRSTCRVDGRATDRNAYNGFRCVLEISGG